MPLWGDQEGYDEITFEFPTEADFAQMTPDVSLKSLEFEKYIGYYLGSVKANLSNGVSSELFCKEKFPHNHDAPPEVFEFEHDKSIGIVGADVDSMLKKEWMGDGIPPDN